MDDESVALVDGEKQQDSTRLKSQLSLQDPEHVESMTSMFILW